MTDETATGERIAKVMARAGVASRRDAEKMILAGRVAVNGTVVSSPALDVRPGDRVTLDGKPIDAPQPARLWLYYKPVGLVTSAKDEKGRQTVFDTMPEGMPRVMSVGRLDLNSEGLLLLTNDGALKRRLELPSTGWLRKYRVRVNGRPNEATFDPLRRGITIDGEVFQPMEVTLDKQQGANAWLTVGIREGKNREIRRAMAEVGLTVNRLIRVSYGPFRLNTMKPGDVVEVKQRVLRDQLGTGSGKTDAERKPRAGASKDPKRNMKPAGGDRPHKPRPLRADRPAGKLSSDPRGKAGGRPARTGAPGKPRPLTDTGPGERPWRTRATQQATGDSPRKPRPPRAADEARLLRKTAGDRPHKSRPPRDGTEARSPHKAATKTGPKAGTKTAGGDRGFRPRAERPGRGATAGKDAGHRDGDKPFGKSGGTRAKSAGAGSARSGRGDSGRPDRPPGEVGNRDGGNRKRGKPGADQNRHKPGPGTGPGSGSRPGSKPRGRG